MRAKIARDRVALPVRRKLRAADDFEAAEFWVIAGADAFQFAPHVGVGEISRARNSETDSLITGAVRHKRLPEFIEVVAPWITKSAQEHAQFHRRRPQMPNAAAIQMHDTV